MLWQYYLLKNFSRFLCLLPYPLVLWIGSGIGMIHWALGSSPRRRAQQQLQDRLGVTAAEAALICRRVFRNIGRTLVEILYIPALTPDKLERWVTIENPHYLREAMAAGHGAVILTAHFGNWEWMAARLVRAGFPLAAIAETQPAAGIDRLLNEYREQVGLAPYAKGNALIAAMKALKKGNALGFLADQDAKANGVFVDFFGRPASTPQGPAVFALRSGAPIVPAFIVRQAKRGHRIILSPPLYGDPAADSTAEIAQMTELMTKVMEDRIRSHPDHWWWFQRRWITDLKTGEACDGKT